MKKRKILACMLGLALSFGILPMQTLAAPANETVRAEALKDLGLFHGVTDTDFALDRQLTRTEALVMMLRMSDSETYILSTPDSFSHPFTDVPSWATPFVGFAYENGLTAGISSTLFGANDTVSASQFLTFMLRALNYSDAEGDFSWDNPYALAREVGILPDDVDTAYFTRGDAVLVAWEMLETIPQGARWALSETFVRSGLFTFAEYDAAGAYVNAPAATHAPAQTRGAVLTGTYTITHNGWQQIPYAGPNYPTITLHSDMTCDATWFENGAFKSGSGYYKINSIDSMVLVQLEIPSMASQSASFEYIAANAANGTMPGLFSIEGGYGDSDNSSVATLQSTASIAQLEEATTLDVTAPAGHTIVGSVALGRYVIAEDSLTGMEYANALKPSITLLNAYGACELSWIQDGALIVEEDAYFDMFHFESGTLIRAHSYEHGAVGSFLVISKEEAQGGQPLLIVIDGSYGDTPVESVATFIPK